MKRLSSILMAVLFCSLQGYAQFWISFGWNDPHCQNCLWMEQAIRMTNRQAAEYHKIIHRYGEKIEREARKHYRYWDQSAQKIYKLRMERDRKLQRILHLRNSVYMCVLSVKHRHASMIGEVGIIIRIIRTIVRPAPAIVMKIITGIASGSIRTIDGSTVSTMVNGIPVSMIVPVMITGSGGRTSMIVLNRVITMAVLTMTMDSGNLTNTIVRTIREAGPVPIITRISTIRTNMTRNVRIGIKTDITIKTKKKTSGLTRIARIAANVRVTGGA